MNVTFSGRTSQHVPHKGDTRTNVTAAPFRPRWRSMGALVIAACLLATLNAPVSAATDPVVPGPVAAVVAPNAVPGVVSSQSLGVAAGSFDAGWPNWMYPRVELGAVPLSNTASWAAVEPNPGQWSFADLDDRISRAEQFGDRPVLLLGNTPKAYVSDPNFVSKSTSGLPDYWAQPPKMDAWARYVTKLSARYGNRADYRIWNEPCDKLFWAGSIPQMANLVATAVPIIRANAPQSAISMPALPLRRDYQRDYLRRLVSYQVGGVKVGNMVNVVTVNPYPEPKDGPESAYRLVGRARSIVRGEGVPTALAVGELNYGVVGFTSTPVRQSLPVQKNWAARSVVLMLGSTLRNFTWYTWESHWYEGLELRDKATGGPTEAGRAWTAAAAWLQGTTAMGCRNQSDGDWSCAFRVSPTEVRRIWWNVGGSGRVTPATGAYQLVRLNGSTETVRDGVAIPITGEPVMLRTAR